MDGVIRMALGRPPDSLDLPQPSGGVVPTRENAAHHFARQRHQRLAAVAAATADGYRTHRSPPPVHRHQFVALTKPSGRFTIAK